MTFTYDSTASSFSDRDRVRLLINDTDKDNTVFQDEELDVFLVLESSSVRLAAALALETIASNEVMVLKVTKLLDTSVDGAKVANALMRRAEKLRELEEKSERESIGFDVIEWVDSTFAVDEKYYKTYLEDA